MDRPDVLNARKQLAMHVPSSVHPAWTALNRCFRHLRRIGPMRLDFDGDLFFVECDSDRTGRMLG